MGTVQYLNWRGVPAPTDQHYMVVKPSPGCRIESAMRRPFGFTMIEVAEITEGTCPSCGLNETLHAGTCDRCRTMGGGQ